MSQVVPVTVAFALALLACFGGPSETPEPAPVEDEPKPAAEAPGTPPVAAERPGHVIGVTSLRKQPTEDKKIDDGSGKQVSNWLATLYRGETVTVFGENPKGDWFNARLVDGTEGWIKADRVVAGEDVKVVTLYTEGKTFRRPDLLALDTDKIIEAGSLLFVIQEKDQFSEVDYPRSGWSSNQAWTLTSELVDDASEVEVAKVIAKIRHLRAEGSEDAKQLEELARSQFGASRLIALLDTPAEEGEGAAGEGDEGEAATDAPAPGGAAADLEATGGGH